MYWWKLYNEKYNHENYLMNKTINIMKQIIYLKNSGLTFERFEIRFFNFYQFIHNFKDMITALDWNKQSLRQASLIELKHNKYFWLKLKIWSMMTKKCKYLYNFDNNQLIGLNWTIWLFERAEKMCWTSRQFRIIKLKYHRYFWLKQKKRFMVIQKLENISTTWY